MAQAKSSPISVTEACVVWSHGAHVRLVHGRPFKLSCPSLVKDADCKPV
jgi:hypothetical protein